jgi:hypothetical protein
MTRKILIASLALGVAVALSPLAQAATTTKQSHMHAKHHHRHMHHRMTHKQVGCRGTYMYHKGGKCMDARKKT